jgi:DNA-directed RNA polymerase specialized sigma subunit
MIKTIKSAPKPIKKPRKKNEYYIDRKELLQNVIDSKAVDEMLTPLATKLQLLTRKYARSGNFVNYTYRDDMQAYAMVMLVRTWRSFKPEKSNNPFAFYTQCIKNSFKQYLNQEKKHRNIRDALLVDQGLSPSHSYQESHGRSEIHVTDEEDHTQPVIEVGNVIGFDNVDESKQT